MLVTHHLLLTHHFHLLLAHHFHLLLALHFHLLPTILGTYACHSARHSPPARPPPPPAHNRCVWASPSLRLDCACGGSACGGGRLVGEVNLLEKVVLVPLAIEVDAIKAGANSKRVRRGSLHTLQVGQVWVRFMLCK
jgi:hypothetical protein